jgi:periplasmic copper chaperone A
MAVEPVPHKRGRPRYTYRVPHSIDFKHAVALFLIGIALQPQAQSQAGESRLGNLRVSQAWSRPTPPSASVGVLYFAITNQGGSADRLVAVSSPVADKVELHESHSAGGVMQMRAVSGVDCPAGATVQIEPGGLHVMLVGLRRPLIAGTAFTVSLQFRDAGNLKLQVPVESRE